MDKKIVMLAQRDSIDELKAYLESLPAGCALDFPDETVLIEQAPTEVLNSYVSRFSFSERAEALFVQKRSDPELRFYFNRHGLKALAQRVIIVQNLKSAAFEFMNMRRFYDISLLLEHGSAEVISKYIRLYPLEGDEQVLGLLLHENEQLFTAYVNSGRFISPEVLRVILEKKKLKAFKAFMYRFYRWFKKKCRNEHDFFVKQTESVQAEGLSAEMQVEVLQSYDRSFIELLLMTSPLSVEAQRVLFDCNFDAEWLTLHVSHLYGTGGYRFIDELEPKLFKKLAAKDLDECLTKFRHRNDAVFVQNASSKAVLLYIGSFWLSDEAQVALIRRGNAALITALISRYSPEHGLCWQAEVALVELGSFELIRSYVSFHTMCREALVKLRARSEEEVRYYYSLHQY